MDLTEDGRTQAFGVFSKCRCFLSLSPTHPLRQVRAMGEGLPGICARYVV